MRSKSVEKELSESDVKLLHQIYKYRALSTAQVKHVGNLGKWFVYKKLAYLRNAGYIFTEQVTGNYIPNQSRQGDYHRISGRGIRLLKESGYMVDYRASDIQVSKYRLPYLLIGNDLAIALQENHWQFTDSRAVKQFRDLNRGDVFHGTLTNPNEDKEYSLYVFLRTVQANTLENVKREIIRNPFDVRCIRALFSTHLNEFSNYQYLLSDWIAIKSYF